MVLNIFRKFVFSIGLMLAVSGCMREQPIYNVIDHPVPVTGKNVTLSSVQKAIMKAGMAREWVFTPTSLGIRRAAIKKNPPGKTPGEKFKQGGFTSRRRRTAEAARGGVVWATADPEGRRPVEPGLTGTGVRKRQGANQHDFGSWAMRVTHGARHSSRPGYGFMSFR